ncbi:hypothetical protein IWW56_002680 [Coemansia sp. RSA 2131]|nr:hypothetical protein IWW56_002680 [Coemansia sp. RSA 2131]KAJ2665742.1 hypothetical protein IW148_001501 [Coemansia sp. RSA 1199]
MKLEYYSALFSILLVNLVDGKGQRLDRRDNADLLSVIKGGVLVADGKLTSCELAVIDCRASITAASCLHTGTGLNPDLKYQVYLDDGLDGIPVHYNVDSITVHPSYNPANHVNDFAIIQYNPNGTISWQNSISPKYDANWEEIGFLRVAPSNLEKDRWEGFTYEFSPASHDNKCDDMSEMYAMNSKDMKCTNWTTEALAPEFNICGIPLGTAYGIANNNAYIIGTYSYSAVSGGDTMCSYTEHRSYYTTLANYMAFITKTLGRDLLIENDFFKVNMSALSVDYKMVDRDFIEDNGLKSTKIAGDFYKDQKPGIGLDLNVGESVPLDSDTSNVDVSSDDHAESSKQEVETESSSGLSNRETVIVAVCVTLGALTIICVFLLYVFWYRKRKRNTKYPIGQAEYQDMLESTIGGASAHGPDIRPDSAFELPSLLPDPRPHQMPLMRELNTQSIYHAEMPPEYDEGVEQMLVRVSSAVYKNEPNPESTTPPKN